MLFISVSFIMREIKRLLEPILWIWNNVKVNFSCSQCFVIKFQAFDNPLTLENLYLVQCFVYSQGSQGKNEHVFGWNHLILLKHVKRNTVK